jgi:hypothetical protein
MKRFYKPNYDIEKKPSETQNSTRLASHLVRGLTPNLEDVSSVPCVETNSSSANIEELRGTVRVVT